MAACFGLPFTMVGLVSKHIAAGEISWHLLQVSWAVLGSALL